MPICIFSIPVLRAGVWRRARSSRVPSISSRGWAFVPSAEKRPLLPIPMTFTVKHCNRRLEPRGPSDVPVRRQPAPYCGQNHTRRHPSMPPRILCRPCLTKPRYGFWSVWRGWRAGSIPVLSRSWLPWQGNTKWYWWRAVMGDSRLTFVLWCGFPCR
ncbi:hypothetical protein FEMY_07930 [Ferrovum myxofaciens]|uniref:Uncharacterized protein n=1 Tax=Ferrovum myxofaciens TaxID=416213 RepID=A0A149VZG1_9PROT|nr:hypothetical protein FEMY_07930 [Ferrovum myxofaciens]